MLLKMIMNRFSESFFGKTILYGILLGFILLIIFFFVKSPDFPQNLLAIVGIAILMALILLPFLFASIGWLYLQQRKWGSALGAAMIWIRENKAYFPTMVETEPGHYLEIAPIFVTNLGAGELASTLETVLNQQTTAQDQTANLQQDPLLQMAKVKSRAEFEAGFLIRWTTKMMTLDIIDIEQAALKTSEHQLFPPDVSLKTVVEAILKYVRS